MTQRIRKMPAKMAYRQVDVSALVDRFLSGDERAFTELAERYRAPLIRFIYRIIRDYEQAEDLTQITLVRVYHHLAGFDKTSTFSTWIYTIARNLAINELRSQARNRIVLFQTLGAQFKETDLVLLFEDTRNDPYELFRKRDLRKLVEDAVSQLPTGQRKVFMLRELKGKSYKEIADITGFGLRTVATYVYNSRIIFREIIGPLIK